MNHCVPNWNMEDDSTFPNLLHVANQKKVINPESEVVELMWRNGPVVLHCQTHRKPTLPSNELQQAHYKPDQPSKFGDSSFGNSTNSIQEDETASWLHYPLDDPLENEFSSDFFHEMPTSNSLHLTENVMPPSKSQVPDSIPRGPSPGPPGDNNLVNFAHFSRPIKALGSSHCKSNQVVNEADLSHVSCNGGDNDRSEGVVKEDVQMMLIQSERGQTDMLEQAVTSSSGGSGGNLGRTGKQSNSNQSHKRKGKDGDESECQSEVNEYEPVEAKKPLRRSASARRSRAAEVHNLSERRRRDRINEKMKALQELIPHCNKTDKASMLDEAIEYLKSLQLQLQMMWMGRGMVPMMFQGMQHYMPCVGMDHTSLPSIQNPGPRAPLVDQSITLAPTGNYSPMCLSASFNPVNFQNHIQNANPPDLYGGYLAFHHMQTAPQGMNLFPYGHAQMVQQRDKVALLSSSSGHCSGGDLPDNIQNGKLG